MDDWPLSPEDIAAIEEAERALAEGRTDEFLTIEQVRASIERDET